MAVPESQLVYNFHMTKKKALKKPTKNPKSTEPIVEVEESIPDTNPEGRPLLFKTPEELQQKIDEYFASCWKEVWVEAVRARYAHLSTTKLNGMAREDAYEWRQQKDHLGNPVLEQVKPYAISALAAYLDTSRQTLINYAARDQFFDTVMRAKARCEAYTEEQLFSGKPATGAIFSLTNNYGYTSKLDLSSGGKPLPPGATVTNNINTLTDDELIKLAAGGKGRASA